MVKGLSRRVIVVDSPDPHIFEQAIFIVRNDAMNRNGVTAQRLVDEACRVARTCGRTATCSKRSFFRRGSPALWGCIGAGGPSGRRGHRRGMASGHAAVILLFSYHFSPHLGADGVFRSALPFCPGAVSYEWDAGKPALPSADRKAPCGKCRISFISIIMYEAGNPLSKFSQFPVANFFCV